MTCDVLKRKVLQAGLSLLLSKVLGYSSATLAVKLETFEFGDPVPFPSRLLRDLVCPTLLHSIRDLFSV